MISLALSAFFNESLNAQSATTTIIGTVLDQQGKVVFGAAVTLSNSEKSFVRTVITGENGMFSFPAIQPAIYRLEVEMNGFKKFSQNEIRALVDTPTELSVVLQIGAVSETVNVRSDTAESLLMSCE